MDASRKANGFTRSLRWVIKLKWYGVHRSGFTLGTALHFFPPSKVLERFLRNKKRCVTKGKAAGCLPRYVVHVAPLALLTSSVCSWALRSFHVCLSGGPSETASLSMLAQPSCPLDIPGKRESQMPFSDWSVAHCLDGWFVQKGQAHCGRCHP